jgi:hypothetical protein
MKTLIFSSLAIVGLLLASLQHQQIRDLRAENATLQQSSIEVNQLKTDLAKSTDSNAQDADEILRLREENHDLLKLRGEINQLRDAKVQFEKVSAENQRLVAQAKNAAHADAKQSMRPVTIRVSDLINRGWNTPENALQTFYWAQRDGNIDSLERSVSPGSWNAFHDYVGPDSWRRQQFKEIGSIDIVARRDLNATTVQFGIQLTQASNPQYRQKIVVTLVLQDANWWRVESTSY